MMKNSIWDLDKTRISRIWQWYFPHTTQLTSWSWKLAQGINFIFLHLSICRKCFSCLSFFLSLFLFFYMYTVKMVFTCIVFSYWWYRAGKRQIHYILQKRKTQVDPCVVFLFVFSILKVGSPIYIFAFAFIHFFIF